MRGKASINSNVGPGEGIVPDEPLPVALGHHGKGLAEGSALAASPRFKSSSMFVSVVWAIDGPRFAAMGVTEQDCLAQVARYVAEQAQWQLWPSYADHVATLLAAGDHVGAVTEYFSHVGERWDAEWITTSTLTPNRASSGWSGDLPRSVARPRTGSNDRPHPPLGSPRPRRGIGFHRVGRIP